MSIILPPKPTVRKPDWATGSSSIIQDPGAGKQEIGWTTDSPSSPYGEKPPFPFFNWIQNTTGKWIDYFDAALDYLSQNLTKIDYFYCPTYFLNSQGRVSPNTPTQTISFWQGSINFTVPYNCFLDVSIDAQIDPSAGNTVYFYIVGPGISSFQTYATGTAAKNQLTSFTQTTQVRLRKKLDQGTQIQFWIRDGLSAFPPMGSMIITLLKV